MELWITRVTLKMNLENLTYAPLTLLEFQHTHHHYYLSSPRTRLIRPMDPSNLSKPTLRSMNTHPHLIIPTEEFKLIDIEILEIYTHPHLIIPTE